MEAFACLFPLIQTEIELNMSVAKTRALAYSYLWLSFYNQQIFLSIYLFLLTFKFVEVTTKHKCKQIKISKMKINK